jgi:glycosyltransferase involved in cell wall biosynthesis
MAPSVLAGILHIPLFSEVNGIFSEALSFRRHGIVGIWINNLIERFAYKCSKRVIVVTEGIKEHLANALGVEREKISVISNGADIELIKPQDPGPARQRLGIPSTSYVIGYLGNFEYYQGIEYLIMSLPDIIKKYPDVCCLLVGDGSLKPTIVTLAKELGVFDSCVFAGTVSHSKVGAYLAAMDIGVTTKVSTKYGYSRHSPLKLYEYMSAGRPVVATDVIGLGFIKVYCCGLLVKPQDPTSIAGGILELLEDPEKRFDMGKNGRLYMEEFGSWEKVISKVESVILNEREHSNV